MSLLRTAGRFFRRRRAPGAFRVRAMIAADRPAVVAMLAALATYEQRFEHDRTVAPLAAECGLAEVEAEILEAGGYILVACDDTFQPIALAAVVVRSDSPFVADRFRRYAYISDLFVAEAWRGAGVGGALIDEIVRRSRALGFNRIGVGALARNDATRAAYTRWGFRAYAVEHVLDLD